MSQFPPQQAQHQPQQQQQQQQQYSRYASLTDYQKLINGETVIEPGTNKKVRMAVPPQVWARAFRSSSGPVEPENAYNYEFILEKSVNFLERKMRNRKWVPSRQKVASLAFEKWPHGNSRRNDDDAIVVKNPYSAKYMRMFEATYHGDPTFQAVTDLKVMFALGHRTRVEADITQEFGPTDRAREVEKVKERLKQGEAAGLLTFVRNVNIDVNFQEHLQGAYAQSCVYGRAAIMKEYYKGTRIPASLKLLTAQKLGKVWLDRKTWKLLGVDYEDRAKKEGPIKAEDMIYFPRRNYHISPDSWMQGIADAETIVHTSETNRLLDQVDGKEIARSMWAPFIIIKFPPDTTEPDIDKFMYGFAPGSPNVTGADVEIQIIPQDVDLEKIWAFREANEKRMIRASRVPTFIAGYEDVTNRATTQEVMVVWHGSQLEYERNWLRNIIEPQWLKPLENVFYSNGITDIDEKAKTALDLDNPIESLKNRRKDYKLTLEFENIVFETMEAKSKAYLPIVQDSLMTEEKFLEVMGMPEEIEKVKALRKEKQMIEEEDKERQFALQEKQVQVRAQMSQFSNRNRVSALKQAAVDEYKMNEAFANNQNGIKKNDALDMELKILQKQFLQQKIATMVAMQDSVKNVNTEIARIIQEASQ